MNVIDLFSNKKYFDNWYQIAITIIYHSTKMTYFISSTCISKHFQFDAFDIKPNHSLPLSLSLKRSWNIYLSYTEAFIFNFEKCSAEISCSWNKQIIFISRHQDEFPPGHTPKADLRSDYDFFPIRSALGKLGGLQSPLRTEVWNISVFFFYRQQTYPIVYSKNYLWKRLNNFH